MDYLAIKNWEKFQHYKDRSPPWIKLHRELLNDYHFTSLQDASKAHLMLLWLLASQMDNKIPDDQKWIKNKLGLTSNIDTKELIRKGFLVLLQDASAPQAKSSPETEAYSKEADIKITHENLEISHIQVWLLGKRAEGLYIDTDEGRLLEKFKNYCRSKKPKYKDYIAAFKNSFEWKDTPKKGKENGRKQTAHDIAAEVAREYYQPEDRADQSASVPELPYLQSVR